MAIKSYYSKELPVRRLLPLYLLGAVFYFAIAFTTFKQDQYLYPEEKPLSWFFLTLATVMWFLVVPVFLLLEEKAISQE